MKIDTLKLRLCLGILGILLPFIVLIMSMLYGYGFPDSISATYYIPTCITPFMIILGVASIILIYYRGYDKIDNIICTIAGISGLLICLFPCSLDGTLPPYLPVGTFQLPAIVSGYIHNISAIIFFVLLAYNSLFLFTKSSGSMTENKRKRNIIYRVCGIGILICITLIIPINLFNIWGGTWFLEAIALIFFGISWITKADIFPFLFCDTKYKD